MKHIRRIRPSIVVLAAALSSMALYACNQNGQQPAAQNTAAAPPALPLTTGAETAPVDAPTAAALPPAPRPKIVRVASQSDEYAYVDQASSMGSAIGSAPPDYGFDYEGVHPWIWRSGNNAARLVEPIDGGYRYYYYQPGAAEPYLIRDPQYAYGFDNGHLVVIYDARGGVLPQQNMDQQADYAGRYLARARALYKASLNSQRHSVIAANWAARRAEIDSQQAEWAQQQSQYSAWQAYHQAHEAEQQTYWQAEHQRRDAAAAQFNQWHDAGYQGPPPPSYAPAAGVAGAALVGAAVGNYIAGHDHRDDRGPPQGAPGYLPPNGGPGFDHRPGQPNPALDQAAAIAQARQQQAQADATRQAQRQSQAQAAAAARAQAVAQSRSQQAADAAARQAQIDARAQAQAQGHAQAQAQAAMQAHQQEAAQALAARQVQDAAKAQGKAQALAARQALDAARAQTAALAHQQQAAQAAAAHQAQEAALLQAAQAHQQQRAQVAQATAKAQAAATHPPHPDHPHPGGPRPEDGLKPPVPQQ